MPFRTNKTRELYIAYVLDEDTLRRLESIVKQEVSEEIDWFVSLADGSSLYSKDLADVLDIPNLKKRAITRIRCKAQSTTEKNEVEVAFNNYGAVIGVGSIQYEVTGDDRTVVYLSDKLEDFLLGQRQWYTPLRRSISGWFIQSIILCVIGLPLINKWSFLRKQNQIIEQIGLVLVFVITSTLLLDAISKYLFPVSFFLIGKGKERHKAIIQWRLTLGVGFILAVFAGVVVTWITK